MVVRIVLSLMRRRLGRLLIPLVLMHSTAFGVGCASRPRSRIDLPAPVESTTLGPGDRFNLVIIGEEKMPVEFTVSPDGSADLPYVKRVQVAGLEPQEIADLVRNKLVELDIRPDPNVTVYVKEYNSKRVVVLGQVQRPGSFSLTPGLTLIQLISQAGGFNSIANRDRLNLTRKFGTAIRTIIVSADAITDGSLPDIPLQAGDTVFVTERVF